MPSTLDEPIERPADMGRQRPRVVAGRHPSGREAGEPQLGGQDGGLRFGALVGDARRLAGVQGAARGPGGGPRLLPADHRADAAAGAARPARHGRRRHGFVQFNGDFRTADDRPYRNVYVFRFDWRDGRLVSLEEYGNPITFINTFPELVRPGAR